MCAESGELDLQARPLRISDRLLGPGGERVEPAVEVLGLLERRFQPARFALVELVDHGDAHGGLAGKVGVHGAPREAGLLADLLERCHLEAVVQEQARGCLDDQRARARLRLGSREARHAANA